MFKNAFLSFRVATQFLSTLPVGQIKTVDDKVYANSLLFYPIVGLLLSLLLCGLAEGLSSIFTLYLCAALVLSFWVGLTGALHLDGLADSADAWLGGLGSKEKTLRIMKDPASGPIAVCVLVLVLLIKFFAIASLLEHDMIIHLVWPLVIARFGAPLLLISTPYVRNKGLGSTLSKFDQQHLIWLSSLACACLMSLLLGWTALIIIGVAIVTFAFLRHMMMQRLNGWTGDTVGALIELLELSVLLALVGCFAHV